MIYKTIILAEMPYKIYRDGTIISAISGKILMPRKNKDGYLVITVGRHGVRTTKIVHRLVAESFVPNPNNYSEVDHIDSNRANPCAENLEWVSHYENIKRTIARGKGADMSGSRNPKARLVEIDVIEIRRLYDNNILTQMEIANKYNIGWSTVHNIVRRYTWHNI